ncbi:MAG TPA: MSMEG_4193 family putative phosphomutase [Actinomycetota bacterium]|jgi:probable phosphoglycerate mutase|nr:MSMEG_4193 family putative phosphomutase [Actinomycetota bacterium]
MKRLLLLRHATTDHTGKRLSGWTPGIHLGAKGREEARALAERLAPVEIHAIYSSPLERCLQTAEAVADPRGLKVSTVEDLGEVRFGEWTGKELSELARTDLWRTVQFHPSGARFPEGESIHETQTRAVAACERLRAAHPDQTVAVCSHADVIKAVVAHYLGMHLDLFQRLVVTTASVTALGFGPVPYLLRLNDSGTTRDLNPPPPEPPKQPGTEQDDASA